MWRGVLLACLPFLWLLIVGLLALVVGVRMLGAKFCPSRLRMILRDQRGSVQSLSFVLTLPFLVLIFLFIVQVAQLMTATIVVHYAAFAAARAATVWIPAYVSGPYESENRISEVWIDLSRPDQDFPVIDPNDPQFGPGTGGVWYRIAPGSPKFNKIASAAILACAAISPSGPLPIPQSGRSNLLNPAILSNVYHAMVPSASANLKTDERLLNKLQYAAEATEVEIAFFHPNSEPPLVTWYQPPDPSQFALNELGWQDPLVVTVRYKVPLMPAIGRILARPTSLVGRPDSVSPYIQPWGGIYVYPVSATIMLGNEGDIPTRRYWERLW